MKILDIWGKNVSLIPKVTGKFQEGSRSKLQLLTRKELVRLYPHEIIYEDFVIPGSKLSVDFFIYKKKLVIEVDGVQHNQFSSFFHGDRTVDKSFGKQQVNDVNKTKWCEINGFKLIRILKEKDLEQING